MASGKNELLQIASNEDGTDSIKDDHREDYFHALHVHHKQETNTGGNSTRI